MIELCSGNSSQIDYPNSYFSISGLIQTPSTSMEGLSLPAMGFSLGPYLNRSCSAFLKVCGYKQWYYMFALFSPSFSNLLCKYSYDRHYFYLSFFIFVSTKAIKWRMKALRLSNLTCQYLRLYYSIGTDKGNVLVLLFSPPETQ